MKKRKCEEVTLAVLPILCINFLVNLHRLRFEQLTVLSLLVDMVILIHPLLIGMLLYRWWKSKKELEREAHEKI
ncbi:hypothetical protein [Streptococcus acidominimus]|uniref:Uncharacterized protein n=1 Tax=Streptococcus acidominimus TaxID=1326 RepID=A0A1Q8EDQ5_STRAI|nr:hypothetical protein [Streptococcus acidominimus]MBF0848226.1 hypothetical protein [Streptococcus danieliae]MBF0819774.1 hypothetical protein [Streptococcus acidominimus]MBF0839424.1 hypothetical protein [Streptococcus acidominimus]OLF49873.1 hypothetical protein BU200_05110 [Streptococcus acidominimus]TFU29463.1 hypothetical protein E4U01_09995 [Streptococcus acidominimus]